MSVWESNNQFLNINEQLHRYIHPDAKKSLDELFLKAIKNNRKITSHDLVDGYIGIREPILASISYLKHKYGSNCYNILDCNGHYYTKRREYYVLTFVDNDKVSRCRYIMEGILGLHLYELPSYLHVHHIDMCRGNDNEENLYLAHEFLHPLIHSMLYDKTKPKISPTFEILHRFSVEYILLMLRMYTWGVQVPDLHVINTEKSKCIIDFYGNPINLHDYHDKAIMHQRINELLTYYVLIEELYNYRNSRVFP